MERTSPMRKGTKRSLPEEVVVVEGSSSPKREKTSTHYLPSSAEEALDEQIYAQPDTGNRAPPLLYEHQAVCHECHSNEVTQECNSLEIVCRSCGLVLDDQIIDLSPEWKAYEEDGPITMDRISAPDNPLLPRQHFTTMSGPSNMFTGLNRNVLRASIRSEITETADGSKCMKKIIDIVDDVCQRHCLPAEVNASAKELCKDIHDKFFMLDNEGKPTKHRGCCIQEDTMKLCAACCFIRCRKGRDITRSYNEISGMFAVPKHHIMAMVRKIEDACPSLKMEEVKAIDGVLRRLCDSMGMSKEHFYVVKQLVENLKDYQPTASRPAITMHAVSIYVVSLLAGLRMKVKDVAKNTNVGASTLRKSYNLVYPALKELLPVDFEPMVEFSELPRPKNTKQLV